GRFCVGKCCCRSTGNWNHSVKFSIYSVFWLCTPRGRHSVLGLEVVPMFSVRALRAAALALAVVLAPASAQAETLRQALENAYRNSPDLMSALLSGKSAAENIALRKAGKLPSIGLNADVSASFAATGGQTT